MSRDCVELQVLRTAFVVVRILEGIDENYECLESRVFFVLFCVCVYVCNLLIDVTYTRVHVILEHREREMTYERGGCWQKSGGLDVKHGFRILI